MTDLRTAALHAAEYLEELEANMLRNDADMMMDPSNAPTVEAEKLRSALAQSAGEPTHDPFELDDGSRRTTDSGPMWTHKEKRSSEMDKAFEASQPAETALKNIRSALEDTPAPTTECPNPLCVDGEVVSGILGVDHSADGDCVVEGFRHTDGTIEVTSVTNTPTEGETDE